MIPMLSDREVLAALVSYDSVSNRPNAAVADWVCSYLERPGLCVVRQEADGGAKVNVIAWAGALRDDQEGLTLCGHLDVVPAGEPNWTSDPFTLVEREGRYFGRGTCDMKGFCALAINRLVGMESDRLKSPLALLLTFDEETGSHGAHLFATTPPQLSSGLSSLPKSVLIGEPTSLKAVRMHKGHVRLRLSIQGRSAHTGSPHLGVNAIEPAGPVLCAVRNLRERWEAQNPEHSSYFPAVPYVVLAVTGIRGGEAANIIPDRCAIDLGIRLLPGMGLHPAIAEVEEAVNSAAHEKSARNATVNIELVNENPPMLTGDDTRLHRLLCETVGQSESIGVSFASDGGWLSTAGYECVLFGPGSIEVAHKPNEYVPVEEFNQAGSLLESLIEGMCT